MEPHDRGAYQEFKVDLIQSTILDTDVLDNLISKCILTLDDREEIDSLSDLSNRNQKLLEILMHRPYNTFSDFVEAIKNSDQKCHTALIARMEVKVLDKDMTLQKAQLTDETTGINDAVKLIKWYKTIVHEINIDKTGILDKLFTQDVIDREVYEKLSSVKMTSHEKNRRLLGILVRKNISSAFPIFLEVLREDSCYKDFADKIEETHVTQNDLELLSIGNRIRERKRNGMSDLMVDQIEKWKIESKMYVETRATDHVLASINSNNCVSVIGSAGSGKTAIARHVALQMERLGYTILTVSDAKEVKDLYKSDRKTLYVVDDMCGNFTASQSRIEELKKSIKDIKGILENGNCKLILTCRLQVFQDKGFTYLEIFKTCVCNLRSHRLSLSSEEKEKLTAEYFKEHAVEAFERLSEYEFLPFLCKLYYVQRNNPEFNVQFFLNDPFSFYQKELRSMYNDCAEGKYKYCALLLLVIFNNKLEEKHLTGKDLKIKEIIDVIIDVCEIDENITGRKLKSQLEILTGTFVTYDDGIYKTIHDKLFDFLAVYFGTQEELISILIKYAEPRFVRERFSVTKDIENEFHVIPLSDDNLQMYIKRVFEDMVSSRDVNHNIEENVNLKNIKLRTMLRDLMRNLNNHEIIALLETASTNFVNVMFVMLETDINDEVENRFREYQSFSIILPDDLVQQYIYRWFGDLTKSNSTKAHFKDNRLLKNVTFRIALNSFMRQINQETVGSIIRTGSKDFLNTMFVKTEHDIKDFAKEQYECFGIVIPERIKCLTESYDVEIFIDRNRPLQNVTFRSALCYYMRQLNTKTIASLISDAKKDVLNKMFVMTDEDIEDSAENQYKCFGIVIPDDLLQLYIERLFKGLTESYDVEIFIDRNRPLQNVTFRSALCNYMRQLNTKTIASLISDAKEDVFNKMFVMTDEDIEDSAENQYKCFGIVIPDSLLQLYIERWFKCLNKTIWIERYIEENRPLKNDTFRTSLCDYMRQWNTEEIAYLIWDSKDEFFNRMFVMTEEDITCNAQNRYECVGIVIPDDLLQQYIDRWLKCLTNTSDLEKCIDGNRLFKNTTFRFALCNYMRQLNTKTIASLILDTDDEFLNKMFVMTEDDIKDNIENYYDFFGIVIPDNLLQHYIERWLKLLSKTCNLEKCIHENRPLKNDTFRTGLCDYMRQLNTEKIAPLILKANDDFVNKMFVMTEEDRKDSGENQYECFGIAIPDDLLQQYIDRWLKCLTNTRDLEKCIDGNRLFKNTTFRFALCNYMRQLNTKTIASLILDTEDEFFNKMFVMTEDDIKDNIENSYYFFGIVIPDNLLQHYIERWLKRLSKTSNLEKCIHENRPLKNDTFRTSFCDHMRQLTTEKIATLIRDAKDDFLNKMFVMTKEDIKDGAEILYECFGIVIPDDLLQEYVNRCLNCFTDTSDLEKCIHENRLLKNETFRTSFCDHMRKLTTEKIATLIRDANDDFLNKRFVMTKDDIKDNTENRYECFGIAIPANLIKLYIERWLKRLTKTKKLQKSIDENRPLKNALFQSAFQNIMDKTNTETIANLIQTGSTDFINTMFVMTTDEIKDNGETSYAANVGIEIPQDLLQQYIEKWVVGLTITNEFEKFIDTNRPLKTAKFRNALCTYFKQLNTEKIASFILKVDADFLNKMFVMTDGDINDNAVNLYERFGIVIPDDILQQYIDRWFIHLLDRPQTKSFLDRNRLLMNVTFCTAFRNFIKQLNREQIAYFIQAGSIDFLNTMFIMTHDDIVDDGANRYEWFGIVIPDDLLLLQQYIERWFKSVTEANSVKVYMNANRLLTNASFRTALHTYMSLLDTDEIESLIRTGSSDFLNTMFVLMENDVVSEHAYYRFESFGIVIPDDMLQQYIERWMDCMTKTDSVMEFVGVNRSSMSIILQTELEPYMTEVISEK